MRVFWVLLSLAVVGGLVFIFAPAGGGSAPTAAPAAPAAVTPAPVATNPATTLAPSASQGLQSSPSSAAPAPTAPAATTPAPAPTAAAASPTIPTPSDAAVTEATKNLEADVKKAAAAPSPESTAATTADSSPKPVATQPQPIPGITDGSTQTADGMFASAIASANTTPSEPVTLPEHPVFRGEKSLPSRAVRKADGTLLVDDRFIVKGSGTAADPFIVPWDMIISAQETYKPRLGMTKIPQRVSMLDGKYIKIVGFIAFPITAASPKEALIMLNQWDGCCIGTPPSPYDAIEVKLAAPATGGQKTMPSGTMTGIFKVDPYEDGGWLLGLFLMEDATLTAGEPL